MFCCFSTWHTVKLQIFVRYLFSYFRLETGSYVLIFVLSRVCEENDVEIQWLQRKKKFSYNIKFRTFQKYEMHENKYRTKICDFTVLVCRALNTVTWFTVMPDRFKAWPFIIYFRAICLNGGFFYHLDFYARKIGLSYCGSLCVSRQVVLLHKHISHQVFAPISSIKFLGPYLFFFFFAKMILADRAKPTRSDKESKSASLQ